MATITLFEQFNIEWLIQQVNGNNLPVFQDRTQKETLDILTDLQKQGYTTLHNYGNSVTAN